MENKHSPTLLSFEDTQDGACDGYCSPHGCAENHPTGIYFIDGLDIDLNDSKAYGGFCTRDKEQAALIVEAVNTHAAHKEAVRELVGALDLAVQQWKSDTQWSGEEPEQIVLFRALIAKHSKPEGE
jgi:hypothetical protein